MAKRSNKVKDPDEILRGIAYRLMLKRIYEYRTIPEMAQYLGISYECYKRFEEEGRITLRNLLVCAITLKESSEFKKLFSKDSGDFSDELWKIQHPTKKTRRENE